VLWRNCELTRLYVLFVVEVERRRVGKGFAVRVEVVGGSGHLPSSAPTVAGSAGVVVSGQVHLA
jgi:hypothetical protein